MTTVSTISRRWLLDLRLGGQMGLERCEILSHVTVIHYRWRHGSL